MSALLITMGIILLIQNIRNSIMYNHQRIVSELAKSRRELMELVDKGAIDVTSNFFSFFYKSLEMLIRIRYFRNYKQLPNAIELINRKISTEDKQQVDEIKKEVTSLLNGENKELIEPFIKEMFIGITNGLIKSKSMFVILLFSKLAFLVSKLGVITLKNKLVGIAIFDNEINEIKQVCC